MRRAAWLLAALPACVNAHPVDEVVQGAYLTLEPGTVRLELDITPGPLVSTAVLRALDTDGDRRIDDAEARTYGKKVLDRSTLTIDGTALTWVLEHVTAPSYDALEMESQTLKIHAVARRVDRAGDHALTYDNRYAPAKSNCIANVFMTEGSTWRYVVAAQERSDDGRRLSLRFRVVAP